MMFRSLRDALKRPRPGSVRIRIEDLPSWLDHTEGEVDKEALDGIGEPRDRFLTAVEALREVVRDLADAGPASPVHPRLDKIAKSSLPLFDKTMRVSLAGPFSGTPDEFYHQATESLKGSVRGLSGPGRYLRTAYPEEMKRVREILSDAGQAVNAMNPVMARSRERRDRIRELRKLHSGILEAARSREREERRAGDTLRCRDETKARLEEIREQLGLLPATSGYEELSRLETLRMTREPERLRIEGELAGVHHALVHLLKRAHRAAGEDMEAAGILRRTLDMLGKDINGPIQPALEGVAPHLEKLLSAGRITIRNQDERRLFEDPKGLAIHVRDLSERYLTLSGEIALIEREIETHPVRVQEIALKNEITGLQRKCSEEERVIAASAERSGHLQTSIPETRARIVALANQIGGGGEQIEIDFGD
jgi:hypothetical protein